MAQKKKHSPSKSKETKHSAEAPLSPLHDRVVIRPLSDEERGERRASGLIIPASAQEKSSEGVVVAVGSGRWDDGKLVPMSVSVGDRVLYGKYSNEEVKVNGVEYVIVSESNILAIVKN